MRDGFTWLDSCLLAIISAVIVLGAEQVCDRLDVLILEQQRTNNWLELQYHEMAWSDETLDDYCEENPEDCEIVE